VLLSPAEEVVSAVLLSLPVSPEEEEEASAVEESTVE
jgi:hypothetical protein